MKIYAVSDIHIDYQENRDWLESLSGDDFKEDILILNGDISGKLNLIEEAFKILKKRFSEVFYVPGNHDLWVQAQDGINSIVKFQKICMLADKYNVKMKPCSYGNITIVPLFSWYDYSFGEPSMELMRSWNDYHACKWPNGYHEKRITEYFISMNDDYLYLKNDIVISFSHFLPSIDLMPFYIPESKRFVYPVLGTTLLQEQIHQLSPSVHVYGHSHVNAYLNKPGILYINNAFGYPYETSTTAKRLICIHEQ